MNPRPATAWSSVALLAAVVNLAGAWSQADEPAKAEKSAADPMLGKQAGDVRDDNGLTMKLVWCPSGAFIMGRGEPSHARTVLSHGYWLGRFEVTQSEWKHVLGTEPWMGQTKEGKDLPVTAVSWDEAMAFCAMMTGIERLAGRLPVDWEYTLPTEAQWEHACRAETNTTFSFGDDEASLGEHAWFANNARDAGQPFVHNVGKRKPNPWSLHDMHGNAREWCRDAFANRLPGGIDPEGKPGPDTNRVNRGGGINDNASQCRSTFRGSNSASNRSADLGFRVALSHVRPKVPESRP